ncbi:MAG: enoyl-CoA hydratase/isomerase family protein [Candidatus Woesearchaeota archaeon]
MANNNKIIFQSKGNIGTILLNNPEKHNAFDFDMIKSLDEVLEEIKGSKLKVIILKGMGKSFCSGGDIKWERKIGSLDAEETKKQMKFVQDVFSKIEALPHVFIAVIQGHAVGGGNELAMACDIRVALPSAKFGHPEISLATVPPIGGTKRLPRLIGLGRAKYMLFTGNSIDSKTALEWGLADFLVPEEQINQFLDSIASKIASHSKKVLGLIKASATKNYAADLMDNLELGFYVECSRRDENKKMLDKFLEKSNNF